MMKIIKHHMLLNLHSYIYRESEEKDKGGYYFYLLAVVQRSFYFTFSYVFFFTMEIKNKPLRYNLNVYTMDMSSIL